jgi:ankyrin repeat protein
MTSYICASIIRWNLFFISHYILSRDDDRITPLLAVSSEGSAETVQLLLEYGAKIESLSKNRVNSKLFYFTYEPDGRVLKHGSR